MPRLEVHPTDALFDEPLRIRALDCVPSSLVTLKAVHRYQQGGGWESWASYLVDSGGVIDNTVHAPVAGTFFGATPMGLIWSMQPSQPGSAYGRAGLETAQVEFELHDQQNRLDQRTVARRLRGAGIAGTPLRQEGLVGTFFHPREGPPGPAVLLLGGSPGEPAADGAALLASRGFATLALALYGVDGLPESLRAIPVENVARALDWLGQQSLVDPGRIALGGSFRGGELALLAACGLKGPAAVFSCSGSGFLFQGEGGAAWSRGGKAVEGLFLDHSRVSPREPISTRSIYAEAVVDRNAREGARLPVEQIQAPLLLLTGQDDQVWPASAFSEAVCQRLHRLGHSRPFTHRTFSGAGHLLGPELGYPYRPTSRLTSRDPITGMLRKLGGKPALQAHAQEQSWRALLDFLQEHLS